MLRILWICGNVENSIDIEEYSEVKKLIPGIQSNQGVDPQDTIKSNS